MLHFLLEKLRGFGDLAVHNSDGLAAAGKVVTKLLAITSRSLSSESMPRFRYHRYVRATIRSWDIGYRFR